MGVRRGMNYKWIEGHGVDMCLFLLWVSCRPLFGLIQSSLKTFRQKRTECQFLLTDEDEGNTFIPLHSLSKSKLWIFWILVLLN